jgi:hypothetical protein
MDDEVCRDWAVFTGRGVLVKQDSYFGRGGSVLVEAVDAAVELSFSGGGREVETPGVFKGMF